MAMVDNTWSATSTGGALVNGGGGGGYFRVATTAGTQNILNVEYSSSTLHDYIIQPKMDVNSIITSVLSPTAL